MGSFDFDISDILPLCKINANVWPGRASIDVNCPFCGDDRKHLNINLRKNVWRCNKCDAHGGMLELYAQMYDVSTTEAYRQIEKQLGKEQCPSDRPKRVEVNVSRADPYEPAEIEKRDVAYRFLLTNMRLTDFHRQNLRSRGLTDAQIDEQFYRSVPVIGHDKIVAKMLASGIDPKGVPGFYYKNRNGRFVWTLRDYPSGIMIPVRDIQGRIEGIQIRLDNTDRRKFRWLSTNEKLDRDGNELFPGGSHTYSWCHYAGPVISTMYLTEGPMKANVIHSLSGRSVIAVPGVNCEDQFVKNMELLRQRGVRHIVLAFDMDKRVNENVQKAQAKMEQIIKSAEMKLTVLEWPAEQKGLDDYLWAKEQQRRGMECV